MIWSITLSEIERGFIILFVNDLIKIRKKTQLWMQHNET